MYLQCLSAARIHIYKIIPLAQSPESGYCPIQQQPLSSFYRIGCRCDLSGRNHRRDHPHPAGGTVFFQSKQIEAAGEFQTTDRRMKSNIFQRNKFSEKFLYTGSALCYYIKAVHKKVTARIFVPMLCGRTLRPPRGIR